eukprot:EG_transcript_1224
MNVELRNLEEEAKEEETKKQQAREQEELRCLQLAKEETERRRKGEEELTVFLEEARRDRKRHAGASDTLSDAGRSPSAQSPQSLRSFIAENESLRQARQGARGELQAMYAELEELQQPSWAAKQRARERVAAADRRQAIEDLARERHQQGKVSAIRKEIEALHQELAGLERQERLASERRQAAAEYERSQRDNESERQAQYMETCRARAAQADGRPGDGRRPNSTTGLPPRRLSGLSPLPRLMTPPPPSPPVAHSLFSEAEQWSLKKEDLAMQKARQRRDLDALRAERVALLQDEVEEARLDVHRSLAQQLTAEAARYKAVPNTPIRPQSGLHRPPSTPSSLDLNPKRPLTPIGKTPQITSGSPSELLAELQKELRDSVAEAEVDQGKKAEETQALFAKHAAEQQRIDEAWAVRSVASWADARDRDLHLHREELCRQKGEVSKMRERLRLLEAEDAEAKARAAEAERARFETLQAELAAELERQRALAALPRPEDAGSPGAAAAAEEIERRVEQARQDRAGEQARWAPPMATHPEFQAAPEGPLERSPYFEDEERKNDAARRIQAFYHRFHFRLQRRRAAEAQRWRRLEEERHYAARVIQGVKRMRAARLEAERMKLLQKAAMEIQGWCRLWLAAEDVSRRRLLRWSAFEGPSAVEDHSTLDEVKATAPAWTVPPVGSLGVAVAALSSSGDSPEAAADVLWQLQVAYPNIMAVMALAQPALDSSQPEPAVAEPDSGPPPPAIEHWSEPHNRDVDVQEEAPGMHEESTPPLIVETEPDSFDRTGDEPDPEIDAPSALDLVYAAIQPGLGAAQPPGTPLGADFEEFPNIMAMLSALQLAPDSPIADFGTSLDAAALQLKIEVTEVSTSVKRPPSGPLLEDFTATVGPTRLAEGMGGRLGTAKDPPQFSTAAEAAAVRIQAAWRGCLCRAHLSRTEGRPWSVAAGSGGVSPGYSGSSWAGSSPGSPVSALPGTLARQTLRERYRDVVEEEAATLIQALVRSRLARRAAPRRPRAATPPPGGR